MDEQGKKRIQSEICEKISTSSIGLVHIAKSLGTNYSQVFKWLRDENEIEFRNNYARAREEQADFLGEEIIEIADDGSNDYMTIVKNDQEYEIENKEVTNRSRLRVDARKWIASKLKPKKYGDKIDVTSKDEKIKMLPDLSGLSFEQLKQLASESDQTTSED